MLKVLAPAFTRPMFLTQKNKWPFIHLFKHLIFFKYTFHSFLSQRHAIVLFMCSPYTSSMALGQTQNVSHFIGALMTHVSSLLFLHPPHRTWLNTEWLWLLSQKPLFPTAIHCFRLFLHQTNLHRAFKKALTKPSSGFLNDPPLLWPHIIHCKSLTITLTTVVYKYHFWDPSPPGSEIWD